MLALLRMQISRLFGKSPSSALAKQFPQSGDQVTIDIPSDADATLQQDKDEDKDTNGSKNGDEGIGSSSEKDDGKEPHGNVIEIENEINTRRTLTEIPKKVMKGYSGTFDEWEMNVLVRHFKARAVQLTTSCVRVQWSDQSKVTSSRSGQITDYEDHLLMRKVLTERSLAQSVITFQLLNDGVQIGEYSDRVYVFLVAGKYKKTATAVNQLLPIRRPGEQLILGYLLVSFSLASTDQVLDPLNQDLPTEESHVRSRFLKPVDYEENVASLTVEIIRIEGLPDMDYRSVFHNNRDAVDPYVRVKLGDETVDNKKWKASNNANPQFGHKVSIQYDHPSVSDVLRIEIIDDDPGRDDNIATLRLPILFLAQPVNDEPPPHIEFGPQWLPLYGDVCELNQQVKDTKLAKLYSEGVIEGCSYRGRMLLRITSDYGFCHETQVKMSNFEIATWESQVSSPKQYTLRLFVHNVFISKKLAGESLALEASIGKKIVLSDWSPSHKRCGNEPLIEWSLNSQHELLVKKICNWLPCLMLDFEGPQSVWKLQSCLLFQRAISSLFDGVEAIRKLKDLNEVIIQAVTLVQQVMKYLTEDYYPQLPDRKALPLVERKKLKFEKLRVGHFIKSAQSILHILQEIQNTKSS